LTLIRNEAGDFKTARRDGAVDAGWTDVMVDVFVDGSLLVDYNLQQIRNTIDAELK
jgi:hypothetical protein